MHRLSRPGIQPSGASQSPLSLADIAARVRAASERNAMAPRDVAPRAATVDVPAPQPAPAML